MTRGSVFYGTLASTFYSYVVATWGECVFITETSPLRAFVLILKACRRLAGYLACSNWYTRCLASMQVPFVGFQPVRTSDNRTPMGEWVATTGLFH